MCVGDSGEHTEVQKRLGFTYGSKGIAEDLRGDWGSQGVTGMPLGGLSPHVRIGIL